MRASWVVLLLLGGCASVRGTGDLGLIVEREPGSLLLVEHSTNHALGRVLGLGDLSHASMVFSRDARFAFVFGRDGGLTKVDLLEQRIAKRVMQAGNSIGGAISQDGAYVAVSNYEPGGVRVFRTSDLSLVADIPAVDANGKASKVVGLVDAPGHRFVYSLFEAGEIWVTQLRAGQEPQTTKFPGAGKEPYDGLVTPDGRYYIAGLYGEDGLSVVDLWNLGAGVRRVLENYGRGQTKLPVYKMPHFEGWAASGDFLFVPAVGQHELLVVDRRDFHEVSRISLQGQPVFAVASPDGRRVWVNFALPDNDSVQVVDVASLAVVATLKPGKAVLHLEFSPRGDAVWLSVRDENRIEVYDTETLQRIATLEANTPSGIFFTSRAHRLGL